MVSEKMDEIKNPDVFIPKVIHYVWVGGNPEPDSVIACKESWKKFLPDFEIRRWDESNFDMNYCKYLSTAYKMKKYAFVSDVIRVYILYKYGGVYFDTDLELLMSPDVLFGNKFVLGYETKMLLETCCMSSAPNNVILGALLEQYQNEEFPTENIGCGKTINHRISELIFNAVGKRYMPDGDYKFDCVSLYNSAVFTACNRTDESVAVHHFNGSWKTKVELTRFQALIFRVRYKFLGWIASLIGNIRYLNAEHRLWQNALKKTMKNKQKHKKGKKVVF